MSVDVRISICDRHTQDATYTKYRGVTPPGVCPFCQLAHFECQLAEARKDLDSTRNLLQSTLNQSIEQRAFDQLAEMEDVLVDVVNQACMCESGKLDSMCLSAYADAMRLLAQRGRLLIEKEYGRGVIGTWANEVKP